MKRFLGLVLALILALSLSAQASVDFTSYSLEELVEMQAELLKAMWASKDWQEVEVPAGVYEIGKDIPEGKWTIHCGDAGYIIGIELGSSLNASETGFDDIGTFLPISKENADYPLNVTVKLVSGTYIIIDAPVVFTPMISPSLNFK